MGMQCNTITVIDEIWSLNQDKEDINVSYLSQLESAHQAKYIRINDSIICLKPVHDNI